MLDENGQPSDPANPDAYRLMRFEKKGVVPEETDAPGTIKLETISGGHTRMVANYIDMTGFKFYIGDTAEYIDIDMATKMRGKSSARYEETSVKVSVHLRNIKI